MKDFYHLSDLTSREQLDQGANQPARLAVIGNPVRHSASPQMHQAALDACGIDARYIRLEIESGQVAEAIGRMAELNFIGCNVTVPHKLEVMDTCEALSEDAQALGSVNTIIFGKKIIGHNTDAPGLVKAIREDFSVDLSDLRVMILGAGGGAGRAIATQCARLGCEQLWLVNRTLDKVKTLARTLHSNFGTSTHLEGPGDKFNTLTPDGSEIEEAAGHADLIINATSLGLNQTDPFPIPASCIQPHHMVYDAIYSPPNTPLLSHAKSANARTANGLSMLLHQGVLAFECWFPTESPFDKRLEEMRHGLLGAI